MKNTFTSNYPLDSHLKLCGSQSEGISQTEDQEHNISEKLGI